MTSPWRRDAYPAEVCRCEHVLESHRIGLKTQPCGRCSCTGFDLAQLRWQEHRWVTEEVQP